MKITKEELEYDWLNVTQILVNLSPNTVGITVLQNLKL